MKKEKPVPLQELTMRDFFAAFAMMGMAANQNQPLFAQGNTVRPSWELAYEAADLMVEERKK